MCVIDTSLPLPCAAAMPRYRSCISLVAHRSFGGEKKTKNESPASAESLISMKLINLLTATRVYASRGITKSGKSSLREQKKKEKITQRRTDVSTVCMCVQVPPVKSWLCAYHPRERRPREAAKKKETEGKGGKEDLISAVLSRRRKRKELV